MDFIVEFVFRLFLMGFFAVLTVGVFGACISFFCIFLGRIIDETAAE